MPKQKPAGSVLASLLPAADAARLSGNSTALTDAADQELRGLGPRDRARVIAHMAIALSACRAELLKHIPADDVESVLGLRLLGQRPS